MRWKTNSALFLTLLTLSLVFFSCGNEQEKQKQIRTRLRQWDSLLERYPEAVADSLRSLDHAKLSNADNAYRGLLKTIAGDKTHVEFTSDSLINEVERYYHRQRHGENDHIRSLVYQGIVRYRMGSTDSTVLIPLKEAEKLFSLQHPKDPSIGCLLHFYLGEVLIENSQSESAEMHYQKALDWAKSANKSDYLFDAYMAIYWCKMVQNRYEHGKHYLDTLQLFPALTPDKQYMLYNAWSIYHDRQGEYLEALDTKKKQKDLIPLLKQKKEVFRLYSSISDRYKNLNELDSAMHYAGLAITSITDTTYTLNYLLYEKIADIADKRNEFESASKYRKIGADLLGKTIKRETEARVMELEKKYDLAEIKNEALEVKQRNRQQVLLIIILLLLFGLLLLGASKRESLQKLKEERHEKEMHETMLRREAAEANALYLQKQNDSQQQFLLIYSVLTQHHARQNQRIIALATGLRSKNPSVADKLDIQLKENQKLIDDLTWQYFTPERIKDLFNLEDTPRYLNNKECLVLQMLASNVSNAQIAAFLNTTKESFKSQKNQLKRKIHQKASESVDFEKLYGCFQKTNTNL